MPLDLNKLRGYASPPREGIVRATITAQGRDYPIDPRLYWAAVDAGCESALHELINNVLAYRAPCPPPSAMFLTTYGVGESITSMVGNVRVNLSEDAAPSVDEGLDGAKRRTDDNLRRIFG